MAAREKAMNTWSKGKEVKDQVSDDEESGKDEEISKASKVRRKKEEQVRLYNFFKSDLKKRQKIGKRNKFLKRNG